MTAKIIEIPKELFDPIKEVAENGGFPSCLEVLSRYENGSLPLDQEEAQLIAELIGYEALRLSLKYPYTDEHPNYDDDGADIWGDFCQSVMPHTISILKRSFDVQE